LRQLLLLSNQYFVRTYNLKHYALINMNKSTLNNKKQEINL